MTPQEKELHEQSDRELLIRANIEIAGVKSDVKDLKKKVEENSKFIAIGKGVLIVLGAVLGYGWLWK